MGWERKRGKLHELNPLLRGATTTDVLTTGARRHGAARRTSATSSPSTPTPGCPGAPSRGSSERSRTRSTGRSSTRRPGASPTATRSSSRASPPTLPAERAASLFQRIFSGPAGIDPYASAVSDVYQDLFGEGIYTGKGIYDVDAFERALDGRVPENALLSHDLFEGTFARAGPRHRHRAVRRVPRRTTWSGRPAAPLGARRLAAAAVAPRPGARRRRAGAAGARIPAHRALEDGRQPAALAVRARDASDPGRRLDAPVACPPASGRRSSWLPFSFRRRFPILARPAAAAPGHLEAQPPAAVGAGLRDRRRPLGARSHGPRAPGRPHGGRHRSARSRGCSSRAAASWSG